MNLRERTYLAYLAVLRIYAGYYFLLQGIRKFQQNFPNGDWIGRAVGDIPNLDLYPWYKTFLQTYVAAHSELFGYLVMIGECAVGAGLILGLLTRLNAFVGLFMVANYYLAIGTARGGTMVAQQHVFLLLLAIFLFTNPGRTLGLDGLIFRRSGKGNSAR